MNAQKTVEDSKYYTLKRREKKYTLHNLCGSYHQDEIFQMSDNIHKNLYSNNNTLSFLVLVKIYTTHHIGVQTQSFLNGRTREHFMKKGSCAHNLTRMKKKLFVFKQYDPV